MINALKISMRNSQKNTNKDTNNTGDSFKLFIQSNSPGEISNWVVPISKTFKKLCSHANIHIALTPCQYASGYEKQYLEKIAEINSVSNPKQTLKLIFSGGWFGKKYKHFFWKKFF